MATIGELAQVVGIGMKPWLEDLCPIIMDMLQDSSSLAKREVSEQSSPGTLNSSTILIA